MLQPCLTPSFSRNAYLNDHFLMDKEVVHQSAQTLLCCGDNFRLMKFAVDELYRVFSTITGVTIDQLNDDKEIGLSSGKAISTSAAAHCLLEMKRTAVFLRGINSAISVKISEVINRPVRILYAGTGPYGTLVIPLLKLYKAEDMTVDLLDINSGSLAALQKVTDALTLSPYVGEVYCTDATTFVVTNPYDIVISETMLACLKSEPQVAIMQNLVPQLSEACLFIPEEISVDAFLTNPKLETDRLFYSGTEPLPFQRRLIENVFKLSKLSIVLSRKTLLVPECISAFPVLKLFTTVTVFGNEVLTGNDSSITMPKQYFDFRKQTARQIEFWYVQGEKPRIESRAVQQSVLQ